VHVSQRQRASVASATVGFRCVVSVVGDIDVASVGTLQEALDAVLLSCERDIWFDLSETTLLATCGLEALLDAARRLDRDHRRLSVIAPPGPALRTLRQAGADRGLAVFPDRASAHRLS
jgi:anti-anti-sigma factor